MMLNVCMVTHIARAWINRVRLPILCSWSAEPGKITFPCPRSRLRIWSRDTGSAVPSRVSLLILRTQAESGACLRDSSRVPRWRPFIYFKPPYAIGPVPSLSGHAIAHRWRSLPRVRRHMTIKPQGGSKGLLPLQVTMDQLIFASLSHIHYWYEVGMLKVPYDRTHTLIAMQGHLAKQRQITR